MLGLTTLWCAVGAAPAAEPGPRPVKVVPVEVKEAAAVQAQAVQVQAGRFRVNQFAERATVDPQDNLERFALLTAAGPLVVQVRVTVDGRPFRLGREALVDEQLKLGDTDGDGKIAWDEALANPRFAYGRLASYGQLPEEQRKQVLDQMRQMSDANADGLIDRDEVRRMIAQQFGGPTFVVNGYDYQAVSRDAARTLLDANADGLLAADELTAAADRLKARDADDNDIVLPQELTGEGGPYGYFGGGQRFIGGQQASALLALLGPAADPNETMAALVQRFGEGQPGQPRSGPPLLTALVAALDVNGDAVADASEAAALNTMPPQFELAVNLGQGADQGARLAVTGLAPGLGELRLATDDAGQGPLLRLGGAEVSFAANDGALNFNLGGQTQSLMAQLDADKNGYLEKTELEGNNQGFAAQLDAWDENADGKVFPEELTRFFERQYAPYLTQVSVTATVEPDPVFAALDANADGRLGLREIRTAAQRLLALDASGDGGIGGEEIPERIGVVVGRGPVQYGQRGGRLVVALGGGGFAGQQPSPAAAAGAPDWFVRMDRNTDGDVTPREFLGTAEQFAQLDANADGFIDPAESAAAK
jgi:Ca2+-binding EF-hand superfamily protein